MADTDDLTLEEIDLLLESGDLTPEDLAANEVQRPKGEQRKGVRTRVGEDVWEQAQGGGDQTPAQVEDVPEEEAEEEEAEEVAPPQANPDPGVYKSPTSKFGEDAVWHDPTPVQMRQAPSSDE